MMESTEDWYRCYEAELLQTPKIRCILVQRKMCADLIVIGSVLPQNATQLRFVEHDEVVEAFALPTVDSATSIPSINNSPWIRGAPQSGFSRFMRRISAGFTT
jgi:hypothetical protein